jgi:hypothetical protein
MVRAAAIAPKPIASFPSALGIADVNAARRQRPDVAWTQHQVRRWRCWYRWATLALLAHAFLVVAALTQRTRRPPPPGLIPLTCNEVQHLFAALLARPTVDPAHWLRWSWWRRRQQARARACHYRQQANGP